jgi:isoleucyl-tRNA synthetase
MKVAKPQKQIHFPKIEGEIQDYWHQNSIFEKSVSQRKDAKKYNFYDGPPFATGLPHFGHFVPNSIKDAFPRFYTMKGFSVDRRFGWDCHGVPVEMLIQNELNLKGKPDIEDFGIAKFNEACRKSVLRYTEEWREYIQRLGRWVDWSREYRTMDKPFMESVWHILKTLFEKGLLYEGKQVMSYSAALGTSLSNFEASLDYRDIQDPSVTLKALLQGKFLGKSLLVWTTTPWTLPANVAIAVDAHATYVEVDFSGETLILMKSRIESYFKETPTILREFLGEELHEISYIPFFSCHKESWNENTHKIYVTEYVLSDTGTGAVHTAPAFGEDDYICSVKYNLPLIDHLDENGRFLTGNPEVVVGINFKEGDKALIQILKKSGFLFKHETFVHSYPMCYRSGKPLMYRACPSWFVSVEKIKSDLIANNQKINWIPEHIKDGRFGKWLENARDWNIARTRYWGNPLPIWKNTETGHCHCFGSVSELEQATGLSFNDIHIENINQIEILPNVILGENKDQPRGVYKRVPFVLDCWFESGSMPYAQLHYPFENEENFESVFPADFICEGLDQTRGWFYSLNVLSTALFNKPAFKNVVVNGLVMAADGKKMSKSLKNYPDPMLTLNEFGADSIRLFLLSSPATTADEVRFSVDGVKESTRKVLLPLWNAFSFFSTYAALENFDPEQSQVNPETLVELDTWIKLRLQETHKKIDHSMENYQISKAVPALTDFLDDLNNWYIRRSRRRFWNGDTNAFHTLFDILVTVCQLLAPFAPFASEYFYRQLSFTKHMTNTESVHLSLFSEVKLLTQLEERILERVSLTRKVVELARQLRTTHKLKNRQPLSKLKIGVLNANFKSFLETDAAVICDEINVKCVEITTRPQELAQVILKPNFKTLGKVLGERIKELQADLLQCPQEIAQAAFLAKNRFSFKQWDVALSDLIVELRGGEGQVVAAFDGLVVSLDVHISEELRLEGIAREMVSIVQKARKQAGFEVEDRILLAISTGSENLDRAVESSEAYIEEETLSTLVKKNSPSFKSFVEADSSVTLGTYTQECSIEETLFRIAIKKTLA